MTKDELKSYLESAYSELTFSDSGKYDLLFIVDARHLVRTCEKLRNDEKLRFDYLGNISGIDTTENFVTVYHIASITNKIRLDIKVILPHDNPSIDSVQSVWPAANWYEREIWELYGIEIHNHDNLKRFLLPDDWDQGHPMRKDWDAPDFIRFPEK